MLSQLYGAWCDGIPNAVRYPGPARHIFYPPGDVGPPGINWLVAFPQMYNRLPDRLKYPVHRRAVLPGGAKWLRPRIEGSIRITEQTQIVKATPEGNTLCLTLSDGTSREADYSFLGTGSKHDIDKLAFIEPSLRQRVADKRGYPTLNKWYESTAPHLYFVGAMAGHTFGPTCRFVSGSKRLLRGRSRVIPPSSVESGGAIVGGKDGSHSH